MPGLPFLRDFGVVRPGYGFALTFAAISVSLCPLTRSYPLLMTRHVRKQQSIGPRAGLALPGRRQSVSLQSGAGLFYSLK